MNQDEYDAEIKSSAENIIDELIEHGDYPIGSVKFENGAIESADTTADYHQWTTYSGYAMDILEYAENDPEEWHIYVDPERENNHHHVLETMAYAAFKLDLHHATFEELRSRREEYAIKAR